MPNTFKEFKKYLQFLTPWEQITEINHMIHDILLHNNLNDDINKMCNKRIKYNKETIAMHKQ